MRRHRKGLTPVGFLEFPLREDMGMAVKAVGEKYRCNGCGNEVEVTKVGGGTLICCDQPMEKTG